MKKTHNILIMPLSPGKNTKRFLVNTPFLFKLFFLCFFLIIFLSISGIWGMKVYYLNITLSKENDVLKEKGRKLEAAEKEVGKQLEIIRKKEGIISDFLGIAKSSTRAGRGGEGGPQPEEISFIANKSFPRPAENPAFQRDSNDIFFLSEATFLENRLQEIIDLLETQKARWDTTPSILPIGRDAKTWFTSRFAWRTNPFTGRKEFHQGLDIAGARGTPILAPADGQVVGLRTDRYLGKNLVIKHNGIFSTVYGHLLKYSVKKWEKVKRGQVIAYMGSTGRSTGYHVHYEVKKSGTKVDPSMFILNQ